MLQQHSSESETVEVRLQQYLDELEKPMTTLGEAERQEWRAEAESHLLSLIAAYEELGDSHEDAVRAALGRFGKPKNIGFRMRWASVHQQARQNPENQVTNYVLRSCASFFVPALVSFLAFILLYDFTENVAAQALARNAVKVFILLGPFLSGGMLGRRLPWLQDSVRRIRAMHGAKGVTRLRFGMTAIAITTSFELGLFWSLLRSISDGAAPGVYPTDFIPGLLWLPITLSVAYWSGNRPRVPTSADVVK